MRKTEEEREKQKQRKTEESWGKLRKVEESWGKERKAEEKEGGDLLKEVGIQRRGRRTHSNWFHTLESNITMAILLSKHP